MGSRAAKSSVHLMSAVTMQCGTRDEEACGPSFTDMQVMPGEVVSIGVSVGKYCRTVVLDLSVAPTKLFLLGVRSNAGPISSTSWKKECKAASDVNQHCHQQYPRSSSGQHLYLVGIVYAERG